MSKDEQEKIGEEVWRRAYYGELSAGVRTRGRAVSSSRFKEPEIPDFDDRPWNGPYDDNE